MGCSYFYFENVELIFKNETSESIQVHVVPHEEPPEYNRAEYSTLQDFLDTLPTWTIEVYRNNTWNPWISTELRNTLSDIIDVERVKSASFWTMYCDRSIWREIQRST